MRLNSAYAILVLIGLTFTGFSQTISSPYSNFGIGELTDFSMPTNEAMGATGIGMPDTYSTNTLNPAWLPFNVFTTFQAGIKADVRRYESETQARSRQSSGSIRYLSLAFPLIRSKWSTSVSLLPYSFVNYNLSSSQTIEETGELVNQRFAGSGGLSQVSWAHGFKLVDEIYLGARTSFVFGSINRNVTNTILDPETGQSNGEFAVSYDNQRSYSDVTFALSAGHRIQLGEEKSLNYGVVYDLSGNLEGERSVSLARLSAAGVQVGNSVQLEEGTPIAYKIPSGISFGLSYEQSSKLTVGADVTLKNWTEANSDTQDELRNTMSFAVGGKFVPDYKSVTSYFERIHYRAGFQYKQVPYIINQTEINEFGINFGVSLPVSGVSSLDTALRFGWRGTTDNSLVRENFYQIVFGLTINDRWFIKRRYD